MTSGPEWNNFCRDIELGSGDRVADAVAAALFSWEIHRGAGLDVAGVNPRLGSTATLHWRLGPLRIPAPVEIVAVHRDGRERGFTYRALPGHPEEGEETFLVRVDSQKRARFCITARSRPATWWARLGAPVSRLVQKRITYAYLEAARKVAGEVEAGCG